MHVTASRDDKTGDTDKLETQHKSFLSRLFKYLSSYYVHIKTTLAVIHVQTNTLTGDLG